MFWWVSKEHRGEGEESGGGEGSRRVIAEGDESGAGRDGGLGDGRAALHA